MTSNKNYQELCEKWGFEAYRIDGKHCPRLHLTEDNLAVFRSVCSVIAAVTKRYAENSRFPIVGGDDQWSHGFGPTELSISSTFIGRPDFIVSAGVPKLLELNADAAVGGLLETSLAHRDHSAIPSQAGITFLSPLRHLAQSIATFDKDLPGSPIVLSSRRFSNYNLRMAERVALYLSDELGYKCSVAFPDQISNRQDGVYLGDQRISSLICTDVIMDVGPDDPLVSVLRFAAVHQVRTYPDSMYRRVEDKISVAKLWADLSDPHAPLTNEEREILAETLIPTFILSSEDAASEVLYEKRSWTLKRSFSYGGGHVVVGPYVDQKAWDNAVHLALRDPIPWVAQRYVSGDEIQFRTEGIAHLEPRRSAKNVSPIISPFLVSDTVSGFLCRVPKEQSVIGLRSGNSAYYLPVSCSEGVVQ